MSAKRLLISILTAIIITSIIFIPNNSIFNYTVTAGTGAPPVNGTTQSPWYIDGNIVREHEWINTSDIQINDTAYMDWTNVTAEVFGNITINATGNFNLTDCSLVLNGNLTIHGTATFRNVVLKMNCSTAGEYRIEVFGTLHILDMDSNKATEDDASVIKAYDPGYNYLFRVNEGAAFEMKNSFLHGCGFYQPPYLKNQYGLFVQSNASQIENNTFTNNYVGLYLNHTSNNRVSNNTFKQNTYAGVMITDGTDNAVDNNTFDTNRDGVQLSDSSYNTISNNTIVNNYDDGIELHTSPNNTIEHNTISTNVDDGVDIDSQSNDNDIWNNTISTNLYGTMITDAYDNFVYNNTYTNNINSSIGLYSLSSGNKIIKNTCTGNKVGIGLLFVSGNIFEQNTAQSNFAGIGLSSSTNNVFTNNTVTFNTLYGMVLDSTSSGNEVHYNNIHSNTLGAVSVLDAASQVNAIYNWWGHVSGPYHPTTNPSGAGNSVSNYVIYRPWGLGNTAPSIDVTSNPDAVEDSFYEMVYSAHDNNGDDISWMQADNASWLHWGAGNHTLYGKPTNVDVGSYQVRINISDGHSGYDEHNFTLNVANLKPKISTANSAYAYEDKLYSRDYNSDDDGQGTISWHLSTNATWLNMNSTTGLLNGTPANEDVGRYWVNVSVDDGNGGSGITNFTLTVINTNDLPTIETTDNKTAYEDEYYEVAYSASDVDAGSVQVWTQASNASWLSWGSANHTLYGTPHNEDVGSYWVRINVSDTQGGFDEHYFKLEVVNVNDPPTLTGAPEYLEVFADEDKILDLASFINDIDNISSELKLIVDSDYATVNGLKITFNYPAWVSTEEVLIAVSDGIVKSPQITIRINVLTIDIFYPYIEESSPKGNDVLVNTTITVIFNESMKQSTAEGAFSIDPPVTGKFDWVDNKLIFDPDSDLSFNTTYTITINTDATSFTGMSLLDDYIWNFTTEKLDTDGDGKPDDVDTDDDNDGFLDEWEDFMGTDTKKHNDKPTDTDFDGEPDGDSANSQPWMDTDDDDDGLTDLEEGSIGTNPFLKDTDSDGIDDGEDEYPLDPSKWEKEAKAQKDEDNTMSLLAVILIIVIVVIVLIFLLLKRGKRAGELEEEKADEIIRPLETSDSMQVQPQLHQYPQYPQYPEVPQDQLVQPVPPVPAEAAPVGLQPAEPPPQLQEVQREEEELEE